MMKDDTMKGIREIQLFLARAIRDKKLTRGQFKQEMLIRVKDIAEREGLAPEELLTQYYACLAKMATNGHLQQTKAGQTIRGKYEKFCRSHATKSKDGQDDYAFVPLDSVFEEFAGISAPTLSGIRAELMKQGWTFTHTHMGPGWFVRVPPENKEERLVQAVREADVETALDLLIELITHYQSKKGK